MCFVLYIWYKIQESNYGHKKEKSLFEDQDVQSEVFQQEFMQICGN